MVSQALVAASYHVRAVYDTLTYTATAGVSGKLRALPSCGTGQVPGDLGALGFVCITKKTE